MTAGAGRAGEPSRAGHLPPARTLPRLYAIVDAGTAASRAWSVPDLAAACLAGGARWLQVRGAGVATGVLLRWCDEIVRTAGRVGAAVIVNDRIDVARMSGADGVHLGQHDLPPAAARRQLGPEAIVGLSTHTAGERDDAWTQPLTYVAVGPVYGTSTKATGYAPVGLEAVRAAALRRPERPVVAIGGITLGRAPAVVAAGAAAVAVIGDLFAGGDPEARVRAYVNALGDEPLK
ncbi:MAG: thiamine phosphate synthase [Acidobacteria bacterium]|nr:thiamine phosphate synthase [Acidobacteriota bacterium]